MRKEDLVKTEVIGSGQNEPTSYSDETTLGNPLADGLQKMIDGGKLKVIAPEILKTPGQRQRTQKRK